MKLQMNWAVGIVVSYVAFAAATTGFVAFALGRPVNLVAPDYYAQSLRQDQRMAAVKNAQSLTAASVVRGADGAVVVSLPASHAGDASGTITLYRASVAAADRVIDLKTDAAGRQRVSLAGLRAGMWSVRVRWTAQGREFYVEQPVVVR